MADSNLFEKLIKMSNTQKYNDRKNKAEVIKRNNYEFLMENTLNKYIFPSFEAEEKYIKSWREFLTIFVLVIMVIELVVILGSYIIGFFSNSYNVDASIFSIVISGFFVQTIGLFTIIFNYLFNRKDNKILDIIEKFISKRSDHDLNNK